MHVLGHQRAPCSTSRPDRLVQGHGRRFAPAHKLKHYQASVQLPCHEGRQLSGIAASTSSRSSAVRTCAANAASSPADTPVSDQGEPAVIILVEPKRGENIGAAARAMKNFGLRDLRLVKPAEGWEEKARAVSARALDLLEKAKVYDTLDEALADLQYVYATSGRPRDDNHIAKDVVMLRNLTEVYPRGGTRVGIMFGREDQGLYNEELVRANAILTIDTDPGFYSLNLGQAVLIVSYEMFQAPERPDLGAKLQLASKHEVEGMLKKLFSALEARDFFNKYNRETLQFALRGMFDRVDRLSSQDVAAWIKVVKAMDRSKGSTTSTTSTTSTGADGAEGDGQ